MMIEEAVETEITTEMTEVEVEEITTEMIEVEVEETTIEMVELPEKETEGTSTTLGETMTGILKEQGKTMLQTCLQDFTKSSMVQVDNLSKRLSPSINSGLDNLKESIPELKDTVDAVISIPFVSQFLRTQNKNKEEKQEEKKDV